MTKIKLIAPPPPLIDPDKKLFQNLTVEGKPIGEPYSYNDYLKMVAEFSGVNKELLGPAND